MELAEIALWASGDILGANLERIRSAAAAINNSPQLPQEGRERAEFILSYLHGNILRSYSAYQTRVDTIFTNGNYNCVSSAVVFIILCESAGIRTSAVVTREHAFAIVHIDGQNIDVETTNRYGFDPGSRKEFHDQFGRLTGFSHVPAQNYRDRQTINIIELITLIFNNRAADHERNRRFAESVPIAVDRAALLFGGTLDTAAAFSQELFPDPRKDLLDELFNYGNSLLRANREEDALRWGALASSKYPAPDRWQIFLLTAAHNQTAKLLRNNRITEARNFLEAARASLTQENFLQVESLIIEAELLDRANRFSNAAEGDEIIAAVEQARNSGRISERKAAELTSFTILRTAAILCAAPARDWRSAIDYLESAAARYGSNREIDQTLRNFRTNLAADYHNRFAAEWNRRNYDEALRILDEGLAQFPDNRQLLNDRETAARRRQ